MRKWYILAVCFMVGLFAAGCETEIEHKYRVLYIGNGHTGGERPVDSVWYTSGMEATVLPPGSLVREGYTFKHWVDDNYHLPHNPGDKVLITNSYIYLTAIWEQN